ncbi:MAG: transposase [Verrucomicrobia bacterium]|nr:transposase [Verrucomicrobiota bacterium]
MTTAVRKSLCVDALLSDIFHCFQKVPDPRVALDRQTISFTDVLMSGLAVFGLKFPSLLKYDQGRDTIDRNLLNLYHIGQPPSDTYLRERLDELNPRFIRPVFKKIFAKLQRGKCLEAFEFLDGRYLLPLDGTGKFSSSNVCCPQCCKKEHEDGSVTYYHQMLGACIVHPDQPNVIPLCPEIIQNGDGAQKNDCERNAAKRFVENFTREHPHLKVIILGDGISSNAPYIRLLEEHKMKYLLGAKPGDHKSLFATLEAAEVTEYHEISDEKGFLHQFRFLNDVALNASNPDVRVNVLEYMQTDPKGKETVFSWVTNIHITKTNAFMLMRGGRTRWKIENETFNTLKNLGYNLEHNYGHGKQFLSTILCLLMLLSFFIDQIQGMTCSLFQAVKKQAGSFQALWEELRTLFKYATWASWEGLYRFILSGKKFNTS